jgi:superfamily II DNA/RNA helicase
MQKRHSKTVQWIWILLLIMIVVLFLKPRGRLRRLFSSNKVDGMDNQEWSQIDVVYYINLDHRTDRRTEIEAELDRMHVPRDKVVRILNQKGVKAAAIHGNKSQNARQNALNAFKDGSLKVLIATDIAARGIDISGLEYVINYELPNIAETYVHRIGRTGRADASGASISFCAADERAYLKDIEKLIKLNIPLIEVHPFAEGANAEWAKPENRIPAKQGQGQRQGQRQPSTNRPAGNNSKGGNGRRKSGNGFARSGK